jgi:general secretion pathway protein M
VEKRDRLKSAFQVKIRMLEDMQKLKVEYRGLGERAKQLKAQFSKREKGFTLFSFLDKLARDVGVKNNIVYMKPSRNVQKNRSIKVSSVEMKIQAIGLPKLADYLYKAETSQNMIIIRRASLTKKGKTGIDAVLQVEAMEL